MTEILNLSVLCRCCHSDEELYHLGSTIVDKKSLATVLQETFDVYINQPPLNASYSICNKCMQQLVVASTFKKQVIECERQFKEFCKNELYSECQHFIKTEPCSVDCDSSSTNIDIIVKEETGDIDVSRGNITCKKENNNTDHEPAVKLEDQSNDNDGQTIQNNVDTKNNINKKKFRRNRKIIRKKYDVSLEQHHKTKNGKTYYSCKLCRGKYIYYRNLRKHIFAKHGNVYYKCATCHANFDVKAEFLKHTKMHEGEKNFKCVYCNKAFSKPYNLKVHENSHIKEKMLTCYICQKKFMYKQTLKRHLIWHEGKPKKILCEICGHGFNDNTNLQKHIQVVHEKKRMFPCQLCPRTYTAKKHLVVHMRQHTGERPYACDVCGESFITNEALKHHRQEHDINFKVKYICKVCNAEFDHKGRYRYHLKSHQHKSYTCYCGKIFTSGSALRRHKKEKEGAKFACDLCPKIYIQKVGLLKHKNYVHNGKLREKKECEICHKEVTDMYRHEMIHAVKTHACDSCDKSFAELKQLKRHVKIQHEGERPHACDCCDKKYVKLESLKMHKKRKHTIQPKIEAEYLDSS